MNRVPLKHRITGQWNDFESLLFNLVTQHGAVPGFFSKRLAVTQAMLDAYDAMVADLTQKGLTAMAYDVTARVARMGAPGSGFAKGAIRSAVNRVPVLLEFDHSKPIGEATLRIGEDDVVAEMRLTIDPAGKYPALGGTAHQFTTDTEGKAREVTEFSVLMVGLSDSPNEDVEIQPITGATNG